MELKLDSFCQQKKLELFIRKTKLVLYKENEFQLDSF